MMALTFLAGQAVFMDQNSQNIVLNNNSESAWPTQILILFFRSLDNLL